MLPRSFFDKIQSLFIRLPWAGKQPRVKWRVLTLPNDRGGLSAPDLEAYYRAAQGMFAHYCLHGPHDLLYLWLECEAALPLSLPTALLSPSMRHYNVVDLLNVTTYSGKRMDLAPYTPLIPLD